VPTLAHGRVAARNGEKIHSASPSLQRRIAHEQLSNLPNMKAFCTDDGQRVLPERGAFVPFVGIGAASRQAHDARRPNA
jgi:hypothetical protein